MATVETEVRVIMVHLFCDKCGEEMVHNGIELLSLPPQYPHICPNCGNCHTTRQIFPYTKYAPLAQ